MPPTKSNSDPVILSKPVTHPTPPPCGLTVGETRLVADLRLMQSQVEQLYRSILLLRTYDAHDVKRCSDRLLLGENVQKVDEVYLWFLTILERASVSGASEGPPIIA